VNFVLILQCLVSFDQGYCIRREQVSQDIAEATTKFLLQKTAKRPVIIPVIISV
jgi:mRNA degradation ribonuclease J1/J2